MTKFATLLPKEWSFLELPQTLCDAVEREYAEQTVYPPKTELFRALELVPPEKVRVVILGQDPYHGDGQAMGLAFSVPRGAALPPSLKNIFRERSEDLSLPLRTNGDLSDWAAQGVLLLNTALTVRKDAAGSHKAIGWRCVVDELLRSLSAREQPIAVLLWGNPAAKKEPLFASEHPRLILRSAHPSPLSAYRGFFGSKPFSQINAFLTKYGEMPIRW